VERRLAWEGLDLDDIKNRVSNGKRPKLSEKTLKDTRHAIVIQLIRQSWNGELLDRPDFNTIVNELTQASTTMITEQPTP